jgi:hypothetical protein
MKSKHTKGPWSLYRNGLSVGAEDSTGICEVWERNNGEGDANACLIAAAPETAIERDNLKAINAELFDALERAAKIIKGYAGSPPPKITALIAKAKGE